MNETEKVAIINICKEIQFNIEKADPADKKTIAQLNEIHNKSESYVQFLSNIVDHLDPRYHANINLKPLDTVKTNELKNKSKSNDHQTRPYDQINSRSYEQYPPNSIDQRDGTNIHRPKIIAPQPSQIDFQNKNVQNNKTNPSTPFTTPFIKQNEIISKNSSFNKLIPQNSIKSSNMAKFNIDMPPPQPIQKFSKESKVLERIGVNYEFEEKELNENTTLKKTSNFNNNSSSQNFSSMNNSEKNLLNELVVKSKFERKSNEYNIKILNSGYIEMLNIGFNFFIKNLLNNLEKVAAIEKNSETLGGFLKDTANIPQAMKILENQDFKKTLLTKKIKPEQFANMNFSLLLAPNKTQILKQLETFDKDQQATLEEKIRTRKLFEIYEEKPIKKIKKQLDESKDVYDILLKYKNEKARESDNQRKNAEEASRTIDIFLRKNNSNKMNADPKEQQQKNTAKEISKMNESKKNSIEKLRITLKTLIYVLEHDPNFRKMPILMKAYMKQNY